MWKVADESVLLVGCNPESNFPISIELQFGGRLGTQERLDNNHGVWFGVEDAKRLISQLEQAIQTVGATEKQDAPCPYCQREDGGHYMSLHPYPLIQKGKDNHGNG